MFAFFAGISGAGMAILTPDVKYSFPHIDYLRHMIGHSMILLGVAYAIIIDNQRPYMLDVLKALAYATVLLLFTYFVNYLLGTNYWFLVEKPVGDNIMSLMRSEPFHIFDLYLVAIVLCYLMYLPYYFKDKTKIKI